MIVYLGARDVNVPWTTAETHSAPKCAFQYGTEREYVSSQHYNKKREIYSSVGCFRLAQLLNPDLGVTHSRRMEGKMLLIVL